MLTAGLAYILAGTRVEVSYLIICRTLSSTPVSSAILRHFSISSDGSTSTTENTTLGIILTHSPATPNSIEGFNAIYGTTQLIVLFCGRSVQTYRYNVHKPFQHGHNIFAGIDLLLAVCIDSDPGSFSLSTLAMVISSSSLTIGSP